MEHEDSADSHSTSNTQQLSNASDVWPPPVSRPADLQTASFHFTKPIYRRIPNNIKKARKVNKMNVSDFRRGSLKIDHSGLTVDGTAAPRAEIRIPVLIASMFASILGYWAISVSPYKIFIVFPSWITFITIIVIELAFRRLRKINVSLKDIHFTYLDRKREIAAIIYECANPTGKLSTQIMTLKLSPEEFDDFEAVSKNILGDRAISGSFVSRKSMFLWIGVVYVVVLLATAGISYLLFHPVTYTRASWHAKYGRGY